MTYGEARLMNLVSASDPGADQLYDVHVQATFRVSALDLDEAMNTGARIGFVSPATGKYLFPVAKAVTAHLTRTGPDDDFETLLANSSFGTRPSAPALVKDTDDAGPWTGYIRGIGVVSYPNKFCAQAALDRRAVDEIKPSLPEREN